MPDAKSAKPDNEADANIFIEIDGFGDLKKLLIDVTEKQPEEDRFYYFISIKLNEEFEVTESDKKWLNRQMEELFRSKLSGSSPEITDVVTRSGSFVFEFVACFSAVSLIDFITKYGDARSGAILLTNDLAQATKWIRARLARSTAGYREGKAIADAVKASVLARVAAKPFAATPPSELPEKAAMHKDEGEEVKSKKMSHARRQREA